MLKRKKGRLNAFLLNKYGALLVQDGTVKPEPGYKIYNSLFC
ncbi:hypothetical protein ABIE50_005446 [Chitinophaga sp. OAE865]